MEHTNPPWRGQVIEIRLHRLDYVSKLEDIANILEKETSKLLRTRANIPESAQDQYIITVCGHIQDISCQKISHRPNFPVPDGKICYESSIQNERPRRVICKSNVFIRPGEPGTLTTYKGENLITQVCIEGNKASYHHWYAQRGVLVTGTQAVSEEGGAIAEIARLRHRIATASAWLTRLWNRLFTPNSSH